MSSEPYEVDECRGVLRVYSDGSIVRSDAPSFSVAVPGDSSVAWKDLLFDPTRNLRLRLYRPPPPETASPPPVVVYVHGGGFCIGSRAWPSCHGYCLRLSASLGAVVVSPDYRLAPENRLPAAVDDGIAAVRWLAAAAAEGEEEWLRAADLGRVFVAGDSAGGNIAHHLAAELRRGSPELAPAVRVRGYVLLAPFFGGKVRTDSEAEGSKHAFLNLELIDRFWRLSIPIGETTDHPLVNPFGPQSPNLEEVPLDPILVVVGGSDLLRDRAEIYATKLKSFGKNIEFVEFQGKQHGFFTLDPDSQASNELMAIIKRFVEENS